MQCFAKTRRDVGIPGARVSPERGRIRPQVRRVLVRGDHVECGGQGGALRESPPARSHLQGGHRSDEAELIRRRRGSLAVQAWMGSFQACKLKGKVGRVALLVCSFRVPPSPTVVRKRGRQMR